MHVRPGEASFLCTMIVMSPFSTSLQNKTNTLVEGFASVVLLSSSKGKGREARAFYPH